MKEKEVMTSTVTNQSRTIVSFRGNSGETWHISPGHTLTMMTIELTENEKVRKLEELGFITIQHLEPEKKPDRIQEQSRKARAQQPKH
jgi:hypothetical protein